MNICGYFITIIIIYLTFERVSSHGSLLDPVSRASRWRFNRSAPINYNDNELFCGGYGVQWSQNRGNCGLCGDNYAEISPRRHEFGGTFGEGVIVRSYQSGDLINVGVRITANHRGTFFYDLCNLDREIESDKCFAKNKLNLLDGNDHYMMKNFKTGWFNATVRLSKKLICRHCVLRWTYRTGNNWGQCGNGTTGGLGCGPQEYFRSCSDISIEHRKY